MLACHRNQIYHLGVGSIHFDVWVPRSDLRRIERLVLGLTGATS